jgi:hypothetical protein
MGTFLLQRIQKSSGTQPASYAKGTDSFFQGAEQLRHEANHSPPPRAKSMKARSYISTSAYTFMPYSGKILNSHFTLEKQGARV